MTSEDLVNLALPEGYRIAWKFCLLPTMHGGQTVWLRSIPVIQRRLKNVFNENTSYSCSYWSWETVGILEDPAGKPMPVGDF